MATLKNLYHWNEWFKLLSIKDKKIVLKKLKSKTHHTGKRAKIIAGKIKSIHENYPEVIL